MTLDLMVSIVCAIVNVLSKIDDSVNSMNWGSSTHRADPNSHEDQENLHNSSGMYSHNTGDLPLYIPTWRAFNHPNSLETIAIVR